MASSERAAKVAVCDGQPDSPSDDPAGCQEASRNTKERKEYNKIGSPWMGIPSCLEAGPGREPAADRSSDTCYNMDCTPDTPEEQLLLSRLGPRRKPRRRSLPLKSYDRLVALAEANAQRRHDEAFGPSQGAAMASELRGDTKAGSVLDLHTMD